MERGERSNSAVENLTNITQSWVIKVKINSENHVGSILSVRCDEDDTPAVAFP